MVAGSLAGLRKPAAHVWSQEQLAAFPASGRCARLVTTRIPSLAAGAVVPVRVDQMSKAQAGALLLAGLPPRTCWRRPNPGIR